MEAPIQTIVQNRVCFSLATPWNGHWIWDKTIESANDESFKLCVFPSIQKHATTIPVTVRFRMRALAVALWEGNSNDIATHAQALLEILIWEYHGKTHIPPEMLKILYPLSNFSLPIWSRWELSLFIFNEFPNKCYYEFLRNSATEYMVETWLTIDEMNAIVHSRIHNNLACWKALRWSTRESAFSRGVRSPAQWKSLVA